LTVSMPSPWAAVTSSACTRSLWLIPSAPGAQRPGL
jgi:hypothetical protein